MTFKHFTEPKIMPSLHTDNAKASALPRFQLRKRSFSIRPEKPVGLSSMNSAFLSGLFAEIAMPSTKDPHSSKRSSRDDTRLEADAPCKKSRVSMARSISRCDLSVTNLGRMVSPTACATDFFNDKPAYFSGEDSLHMPLSSDVATSLAFPHLPATVSQSSCGSLTRNISDLQSSVTENEEKETYGWFVEMDSEAPKAVVDPYDESKNRLAFSAVTAPCAGNHDDEVEWAKAADTVDDVLGDFF
jgi:hypothetical protein